MSSASLAADYVRRIVEKETRGWGDQENAVRRLARRYGVSFWTINNLRTGRTKTVEAGLLARVRAAYLDICERELAKLQHEIEVERAIAGDDAVDDLVREAEALLARIQAKKEALK